jgi:hypothetical protein
MKGHKLAATLAVTMVIAALATPAIAVAREAAPPDVTLAGFSSQEYPAFFKIAAGRALTIGAIALDMSCTSGDEFVFHDAFVRVRIKPNGRMHASVIIPPTAGSNGQTVSGSDSLTARLGSLHTELSGIWRLQLNYSFTNGMSDRCDSGPVRFVATA